MNTQLLLPNSFKRPGIILLIPALLLSVLFIAGTDLPAWLKIHYNNSDITRELVAVWLLIACFFTGFSKEKTEDEMIRHLRLNALLWSVYINYAIWMLSFLLVDGIAAITILVYNMFNILLFYIIIFNFIIYRNSKKTTYE